MTKKALRTTVSPPALSTANVPQDNEPTFSRQIYSEGPVSTRNIPSTIPIFSRSIVEEAAAGVEERKERDPPVFSREIPTDTPSSFRPVCAPVFNREISTDVPSFLRSVDAPVFSREIPTDNPSCFQSADAPAFSRGVPTDTPQLFRSVGAANFSREIPIDTPLFFRSVPPSLPEPDIPMFIRAIPSSDELAAWQEMPMDISDADNHGGEEASSAVISPMAGSRDDGTDSDLAAMPSQSIKATVAQGPYLSQLRELTEPRIDSGMPMEYPADIFRFVSPFVADHIINDDAFMPGNKIFRPPRHAQEVDVRHIGTTAEKPVTLIGRETSPPLELNEMDLDSLSLSKGNFDSPKTFNYTREQIEVMHDRVQSKDINWNDYSERLEVLISTNRAALQMLMKIGSDLTTYQQDSQEIGDLLEGALGELSK